MKILIIGKKGNYIGDTALLVLPEPIVDLPKYDIDDISEGDVGALKKSLKSKKDVNAFIKKHKLKAQNLT